MSQLGEARVVRIKRLEPPKRTQAVELTQTAADSFVRCLRLATNTGARRANKIVVDRHRFDRGLQIKAA
jgi:hypothetical protein